MTVTASGTVRLHMLTMVAEDDGIMVGRPDIGSYALFPVEGAEVLRMLDEGASISAVAAWYEQSCGSPLDVADFLEALTELQFIRTDGEEKPLVSQVRWQRLGRFVFSWPAGLCYAALMLTAITLIAREPSLRPSYHRLFFTEYLSLIALTLAAAQIPCLLVHEGFHALAGRRLGLPSKLRLGRRLYFLVAETRLTSLLSVPRRKRYLPFLAGCLADALIISALTVLAALLRRHGIPAWCPGLCLAVAFTCVLRLLWQLMFYLETDLYYVVATALRCSDLQNATRFYIAARWRRLLRRPVRAPKAVWSDRDIAMARWYSILLISGYGFSLASLAWAGLPTTVHFWSLVVDRLVRTHLSTPSVVDALVFVMLASAQVGLTIFVIVRDRRATRRATQPEGAMT